MGLTILAIPLIVLGVFIKPYSAENLRCFSVSFASARPYCFEQGSNLPEVIKYGSVLAVLRCSTPEGYRSSGSVTGNNEDPPEGLARTAGAT